jgi:hypothetical protein
MTKTSYLLLIPFFLFSLLLGGFGYAIYQKNLIHKGLVYYISKQEILDLETIRMRENPDSKIFFGKIPEAFDLLEEEVQRREEDGHIIVFSDKEVNGKNVKSISGEIHQLITDRLGQK